MLKWMQLISLLHRVLGLTVGKQFNYFPSYDNTTCKKKDRIVCYANGNAMHQNIVY